jgi:hypothetical protein
LVSAGSANNVRRKKDRPAAWWGFSEVAKDTKAKGRGETRAPWLLFEDFPQNDFVLIAHTKPHRALGYRS